MHTITSKRHKLRFYLTIILGSIFFLVLGAGLFYGYLKDSKNGTLKEKDKLIPILSVGIYVVAFYTVYRYYKNVPEIKVDKQSISFNNKTFNWNDLQNIKMNGKRPFAFIIDFPMEATTLHFNDESLMYIFDDMYENSWELKSFLKQVIIDRKEFAEYEIQEVTGPEAKTEPYEVYKGNQIVSLRGISFWSIIILTAYSVVFPIKTPTLGIFVFYVFFSSFWFLVHGWLMHYFKVSQSFFCDKESYSVLENKNISTFRHQRNSV